MLYKSYDSVKSFYRDTYDILMRQEAQNLIPLGNVIIGYESEGSSGDTSGWKNTALWFMAAVSDESGVLLSAIMTPPFNLTLYATDNVINDEALSRMVHGIAKTDLKVPGLLTDKVLAGRFAKAWAEAKGARYSVHKNMRIHELSEVNPGIPPAGSLRPARENDLSFLPYWIEGFNSDCYGGALSVNPDPGQYRLLMEGEKLFILEDEGTPVSMASMNREMRTVCGVSRVYTPPYFRGKGYATSCVAGVSRRILEKGFTKCALYTDLANPTSNSIYHKIGYRPVCDCLEIHFQYGEE